MDKSHGADRRQTKMSLGIVAQNAIVEMKEEGISSSVKLAHRNAARLRVRNGIIPLSLIAFGVFSTDVSAINVDKQKLKKRPKEKTDRISEDVEFLFEEFNEQDCFYEEELMSLPGFRFNKRKVILSSPNRFVDRESFRDY